MDNLWEQARRVTEAAQAAGALQPIATETLSVEERGVTFTLRVLSSLRDKAEAGERLRLAGRQDIDPFADPEPALTLGAVGPDHLCLLNKFCVIPGHLLLVTRNWVSQWQALDQADFRATLQCLADGPALAFFNGGPDAGASQTHKHLQLLPIDNGLALPFLQLYDRAAAAGQETAAGLVFPHRLVGLADIAGLDLAARAAELERRYRRLLREVGIDIKPDGSVARPYNLLLTRDWMLAVPRCCDKADGVSVNSLGFAGALLVKTREQADRLRRRGLMETLTAVAARR